MRNFRNFVGSMIVVLVATLFISALAIAQGQGKDVPNGKGFQALQDQINNIELTPWPQGDKGDKGDKGEKGDTVQGPQGDPGTSSWFDGFETVTTFGSVQIGNDSADCTSANAGTIRFNNGTFEGCNGSEWLSLSVAGQVQALALLPAEQTRCRMLTGICTIPS